MAQQSWTDDPITAGQNRIRKKSIHFTELQDAINAWETAYSITNTNFTDSPTTGIKIKSTVITEMQEALDDLYQLTDSTSFNWTEASTPKTIKPAHINELRTNMNFMQNDRCYQCDSCDTDTGCNICNSTCYEQTCSCNSTCYGQGCTCNNGCYSDFGKGCDTCDNTCYGQSCTCNSTCYEDTCAHCDNSTYRYPWT